MKILVTGARGLLGPFLFEGLVPLGEVVPLTRADCDLRDRDAVHDLVDSLRPDVVVHAAAFTDVDGCERDPERARLDNVESTRILVEAAPPASHFIFVSTDQVYPDTSGPHPEDVVGPVNTYGRTKLDGEHAAANHASSLVLRANFFAESRTPGRKSLSDVIVQELAAGHRFPGFTDSLFSPLHATTLAAHVGDCIRERLVGIYNLGSTGGFSKGEFARMVARHLGHNDTLVDLTLSSTLPGRAPRSHDLRMDVRTYTSATGRAVPRLEEELRRL